MKYRIDVNSVGLMDPSYDGVCIYVCDVETNEGIIGCKNALKVMGPSEIMLGHRKEIDNKAVWLETDSVFQCGNITSHESMKYVIHINKVLISRNQYNYTNKIDKEIPFCEVFHNGNMEYSKNVIIKGPCIIVRDVKNPLRNGGTVWIGTNSDIEYVSEEIDNIS
jgi:hypothetical protein